MRTLVADPEPSIRHALRVLLTQNLNVQVVGEATTALELVQQVQKSHPDVIIADWALLTPDAGSALVHLSRLFPHVQIVVLSLRREVRQAALAAGAHRFISKSAAPAEVLAALASLYGGTK